MQGLTGGGNDKGVVDTVKDLAGGGSGEGQSFKDLSGMFTSHVHAFMSTTKFCSRLERGFFQLQLH